MKCAIVDERISEKCERGLRLRGFQVIKCPAFKKLSPALASHPDMLMAKIGNRIISSVSYCESYPYLFSYIREFSPLTDMTLSDENISVECTGAVILKNVADVAFTDCNRLVVIMKTDFI